MTAYRTGYGVTMREREMTAEERARVEGEVRRWNEAVRARALKPPRQALAIGGGATAAMLAGLVLGWPGFAFATGCLAGILFLSSFPARKRAREIIAASRGPFHAPEGGWRVEEIEVVARSLVVAPSNDEDYIFWWLLEVPGGDWFFLYPGMLPPEQQRAGPFEKLRLVRLSPYGPTLESRWSGDSIPRHGASEAESSDEYAGMIGEDRWWRPDAARDDSCGIVAESRLPAWVKSRD